jgi:TetR/AcrR family transcriptional regulator, transcriptional repressor for nem operon
MMRRMSASRPGAADATRSRILDVAERLVQTRGFNGFSYADIAAELGITKASLHYHFATKAELGRVLVARYSESFGAALQRITASDANAAAGLSAYVKLYADVLADRRMCLCGMVAAEFGTLPAAMQAAIRAFFELNEKWLARLLERGSREGSLRLRMPAAGAARMLVGALEGEMLVARAYGDPERFTAAARLLIAQLAADGARAGGVRPPRAASRSAGAGRGRGRAGRAQLRLAGAAPGRRR